MGNPLVGTRVKSGPVPAPLLDLCPDKTDLRERVERAWTGLQAIRAKIRALGEQGAKIRALEEQAELTAEGDVPKPGYAVPGQRLRGCPH